MRKNLLPIVPYFFVNFTYVFSLPFPILAIYVPAGKCDMDMVPLLPVISFLNTRVPELLYRRISTLSEPGFPTAISPVFSSYENKALQLFNRKVTSDVFLTFLLDVLLAAAMQTREILLPDASYPYVTAFCDIASDENATRINAMLAECFIHEFLLINIG